MDKILALAESLTTAPSDPNGKSPIQHLGFISCGNRVHIRHVPFYEPYLIMVLSGQKVIFDEPGTVTCEAGGVVAVPGPASYDLRNEPDALSNQYRALIIPFKHEHLATLRDLHGINHQDQRDQVKVLKFCPDQALNATVQHYLESPSDPHILRHRLMEVLLFLSEQNANLLSFSIARDNWSQRVRSILSSDLVYEWTIAEVSERLATSETTLRRKLREEDASFREILSELRLANGLSQLLQTSMPVYQIALECGYQSVSRFTSNFRKRFGLSPTEFRSSNSVDEKGHKMAVSGQPEVS